MINSELIIVCDHCNNAVIKIPFAGKDVNDLLKRITNKNVNTQIEKENWQCIKGSCICPKCQQKR